MNCLDWRKKRKQKVKSYLRECAKKGLMLGLKQKCLQHLFGLVFNYCLFDFVSSVNCIGQVKLMVCLHKLLFCFPCALFRCFSSVFYFLHSSTFFFCFLFYLSLRIQSSCSAASPFTAPLFWYWAFDLSEYMSTTWGSGVLRTFHYVSWFWILFGK